MTELLLTGDNQKLKLFQANLIETQIKHDRLFLSLVSMHFAPTTRRQEERKNWNKTKKIKVT